MRVTLAHAPAHTATLISIWPCHWIEAEEDAKKAHEEGCSFFSSLYGSSIPPTLVAMAARKRLEQIHGLCKQSIGLKICKLIYLKKTLI